MSPRTTINNNPRKLPMLTYVPRATDIATDEDVILDGRVIGNVRGRPADKERPFHAAIKPFAAVGSFAVHGLDLVQGFGATRDAAVADALESGRQHAAAQSDAIATLTATMADCAVAP